MKLPFLSFFQDPLLKVCDLPWWWERNLPTHRNGKNITPRYFRLWLGKFGLEAQDLSFMLEQLHHVLRNKIPKRRKRVCSQTNWLRSLLLQWDTPKNVCLKFLKCSFSVDILRNLSQHLFTIHEFVLQCQSFTYTCYIHFEPDMDLSFLGNLGTKCVTDPIESSQLP